VSVFYRHPLPLPLGEVDERSEDGEGKPGCNTLSVTFGDSSPKGRAKGVYHGTKNGAHLPCLSLWERWTSAARTERGNRGAIPSQSPSVTALPKGEPRGVYHGTKNGAHLPCLSLWERWLSKARTERENRGAIPSQSPTATALPKGEPRGCSFHFSSAGKLV
jgi:hypothetical protein